MAAAVSGVAGAGEAAGWSQSGRPQKASSFYALMRPPDTAAAFLEGSDARMNLVHTGSQWQGSGVEVSTESGPGVLNVS